jgi:hypothetical protein
MSEHLRQHRFSQLLLHLQLHRRHKLNLSRSALKQPGRLHARYQGFCLVLWGVSCHRAA